VRVADAERIAGAGGEPAVELVLGLLAEISALRERVDEHDRLLKRDSTNSSLAPSNDPPLTRQQRRARERERAKQQGRKQRGGQPGHEGKSRELAAPERVDDHVEHVPVSCGCGHRFDGSEDPVGDPVLRQKWELPEVVPLVIEHRLHRLLCPACGSAVLAEGDGISASAFGPRLEAHVAVMAGVYRLSRRQIVELLGEMFGCAISVGAVDATIMRVSAMLADPWRELRDAVRHAQAVHADETSWRLRGETNWLWVAASALMACYRIDPSRSQAAAKELLGEDFGSFIITDRYAGYHWLDVLQQQLCWCHAIRQFVSVSERPGAPGRLGEQLLKAARGVIGAHREYLQDNHDLAWLHDQLAPYRESIKALLEQGVRGRHLKTRRFCAGLLDEYDALGRSAKSPG
jgi:transposase